MDPIQSTDNVPCLPRTVTSDRGEVLIRLEGSHTTSTETESPNIKEKKNVKFEDETKTEEVKTEKLKYNTEEELKEVLVIKDDFKKAEEENNNEIATSQTEERFLAQKFTTDQSYLLSKASCNETSQLNEDPVSSYPSGKVDQNQLEIIDAANENLDISQRFQQIMNMFDNFTKNLESLDLSSTKMSKCKPALIGSSKRKRPKSLSLIGEYEEPLKHRSRYEEYFQEGRKVQPRSVSTSVSDAELTARGVYDEYLKQQEFELKESVLNEREVPAICRDISTATSSCELKSLGCQTLLPPDHISLNDLSLMEGSSLNSRSEQQNSLNNYAQAENACNSEYQTQLEVAYQPLVESKTEPTTISPAVISQEPSVPPFNIITIEANATPSSSDLRRAPLCQRLWSVIGDFCAATFLCLQVNRDCIFCLGFFAAFVVSASFLTAFFYHTLSVSPSLWQTSENMRL